MKEIDWRKALAFSLVLSLAGGVGAQGGSGGPGGATPGSRPTATVPGATSTEREGAERTGSRSGSGSTVVQAFALWLESSRELSRFLSVRERILAAAVPALEAGAPADAFRIRLREAAAKGASPETVAEAIEADALRWTAIARSLGTAWPPASQSAAFYVSAALAMRNGVELEAVVAVADWARAARGSPERAAAALTTAATLRVLAGWSSAEAGLAARLVAASKLRVGDFDALSELVDRASRAGIPAYRFLADMESVLGSGGNLKELTRRLFP